MDWMYNDGVQIQKEDYLLGKKVDNKLIPNTDKDEILPPQICPSNSNFTQVDMTKKILEDPLVKIKMRVLESTKKLHENPMRLKKQQNNKPEKQSIEDHQLDIILVSRLKSYEKAGLDLAKILSLTKHKVKKERKSKDDTSSDDNEKDDNYEKSIKKQNKHEHTFTQGDRRPRDKKSHEYRDSRRNENKNKSERHKSVSSSDVLESSKKTKSTNEYKHQRHDNQKYTNIHSKLKRRSVSTDKDMDNDHQNYKKKTSDPRRSGSEEKCVHPSDKNSKNKVHRNNDEDVRKYNDNLKTDKITKYKHQEMKSREKGHNDNKRYRSISTDREQVRKKQNYTSEYSKNKSRNIEQCHRSNSSDKEHKSKHLVDSRNKHEYYTNKISRRSRSSETPLKIKKDKHRDKSSSVSTSSSDDKPKKKTIVKGQHSPEFKKDNEKDDHKYKKNSYGLFIPKGHSVKKVSSSPPPVKIKTNTSNIQPKLPPAKKKKLTDEEMERLRNEMIADAKIRDKDRSSNVKRYRKEDKKEEEQQKPYSKDFLIKQMAHAASQVSVERSIKSNVNKLQKDNSIVD